MTETIHEKFMTEAMSMMIKEKVVCLSLAKMVCILYLCFVDAHHPKLFTRARKDKACLTVKLSLELRKLLRAARSLRAIY